MISVCAGCSGVDIELLEKKFGKENIKVGCIGECGGRDGIIVGYAKGEFIEADTDEEFIEKIESI